MFFHCTSSAEFGLIADDLLTGSQRHQLTRSTSNLEILPRSDRSPTKFPAPHAQFAVGLVGPGLGIREGLGHGFTTGTIRCFPVAAVLHIPSTFNRTAPTGITAHNIYS